jgi:hypothetical protein
VGLAGQTPNRPVNGRRGAFLIHRQRKAPRRRLSPLAAPHRLVTGRERWAGVDDADGACPPAAVACPAR